MTNDLPVLTFVTSPKLSTKKPRVWVSGLLPHMPRTPRHHLLPSPKPKSMPLPNAFRRVRPLPSHATRAMTLVIFKERKDIGLMNVQIKLTSQQSLTQTSPSPTNTLWDPWTWKSTQELQTLPRRMRRTASKQAKLEKHSSDGHGVHQAC